MKLKAEFNHCNTSAADVNSCEVSNAERASANPAEPEEGTRSHDAVCVHVQRPLAASSTLSYVCYVYCTFCVWKMTLFVLEGATAGDVHCPQIDTQQLDRQIKAIMTEVIPFLKVGKLTERTELFKPRNYSL